MSWSNAYVGIPYRDKGRDRSGCDCWGLARLVYAEQLGLELPSYSGDYICAEERGEVAALITHETEHSVWSRVITGGKPFDLIVFRRGRFDCHIGIVVAHKRMLHIAGDDQAKIEDFTTARWMKRLAGSYRHVMRPSKVPS